MGSACHIRPSLPTAAGYVRNRGRCLPATPPCHTQAILSWLAMTALGAYEGRGGMGGWAAPAPSSPPYCMEPLRGWAVPAASRWMPAKGPVPSLRYPPCQLIEPGPEPGKWAKGLPMAPGGLAGAEGSRHLEFIWQMPNGVQVRRRIAQGLPGRGAMQARLIRRKDVGCPHRDFLPVSTCAAVCAHCQ